MNLEGQPKLRPRQYTCTVQRLTDGPIAFQHIWIGYITGNDVMDFISDVIYILFSNFSIMAVTNSVEIIISGLRTQIKDI